MRAAWRAADVRAAEARLLATMPELTLMQRAAAGLARRCAMLLADRGGVYGSRVQLLVGAGNNGGDALFAGALLARRGAQVCAVLLNPERTHAEGLAALRRAGGTAEPASALSESTVVGIAVTVAPPARRSAAKPSLWVRSGASSRARTLAPRRASRAPA